MANHLISIALRVIENRFKRKNVSFFGLIYYQSLDKCVLFTSPIITGWQDSIDYRGG